MDRSTEETESESSSFREIVLVDDRLIAIRRRFRTCVKKMYPIENYISYDYPNNSFKVFVFSLDSIKIQGIFRKP